MNYFKRTAILLLLVTAVVVLGQRAGYAQETRFALVVGNDEYKAGKLATPANDAGLIADALQTAGFTVTGARNLDQATLRESFREFLEQVNAAGPDAVALVYLAGYGLQFQGDNYFVPIDADIHRDSDIPLQAIRVSDLTQPLAGLPGRVKIFVLDAARQNPYQGGDRPLASGLALVEPIPARLHRMNRALTALMHPHSLKWFRLAVSTSTICSRGCDCVSATSPKAPKCRGPSRRSTAHSS
jgi:hypothetical protein